MPGGSTRKLAAIMVGDIAGYARLMNADERGTHARVSQLFRELVEPTIAEHRGTLIKTGGDGFLAIFDSPVEAVRCAIVIQQSMVGRNLEVPNSQWIRFRFGVNLGDVIVDGSDIYGEGVNVAARLEQLAEPGNIYISGGIYEQIRYKLVCGYQSLGDRKVKNIAEPVPIYRVLPDPASLAKAVRQGTIRRSAVAAAAVLVLGIGLAGWYAGTRKTDVPTPHADAAATPSAPAISRSPSAASSQPAPAAASQPVPAAASQPVPAVAPQSPAPAPAPANTAPIAAPAPPKPAPASAPQIQALVAPAPPPAAAPAPVSVEPDMVLIAGGTFRMGSTEDPSEQPVHAVSVRPFLMGKYPVTFGQWRACAAAKACRYVPGPGADDAPVGNMSWNDAQEFVAWLSRATQHLYRLPSEAEWEYAARGGSETRFWWGNLLHPGLVDCKGCGGPEAGVQPVRIGAFPPNPFGLYDMGGGLAQWVEDCWHKDYRGAPADGSAWTVADCPERVLRGGSWRDDPSYVRPASREFYDASVRYPTHGLRVARSQ